MTTKTETRHDKLRAAHDNLWSAVEEIVSDDDWKGMLKVTSLHETFGECDYRSLNDSATLISSLFSSSELVPLRETMSCTRLQSVCAKSQITENSAPSPVSGVSLPLMPCIETSISGSASDP